MDIDRLHIELQKQERELSSEIAGQLRPFDAASPYILDGKSILVCAQAILVLMQAMEALLDAHEYPH